MGERCIVAASASKNAKKRLLRLIGGKKACPTHLPPIKNRSKCPTNGFVGQQNCIKSRISDREKS